MRVEIEEVSNVCKYCRNIMKQPDYPKTLEVYRGEMLCLTVNVEKASKLRLDESSLRYEPYVNNNDLDRLKAWKNRDVSVQGCV
jgi:hypothetical protein